MKTVYYILAGNKITDHDCKIIACVIQGYKRDYICIVLDIRPNTLNTEMRILFAKLKVPDKLQLYILAINNGFSTDGSYTNLPIWQENKLPQNPTAEKIKPKKPRPRKPKDRPNALI
jgi:DNA-binding CsgD family transcriptional regulator